MEFNIAVIKGDGIGPSVVDQAMLALDRVGEIYGHKFNYTEAVSYTHLDVYKRQVSEICTISSVGRAPDS